MHLHPVLKKIGLSVFGLTILVAPVYVFADQISDLQAQVQSLLAQIVAMKGSSSQSPSTSPLLSPTGQCVTLSHNLHVGSTDAMTGGDVMKLQVFLLTAGYFNQSPTGYFGSITSRAVQQWQSTNGIVSFGTPGTTGYGSVGPKTRAAMVCGNSTVVSSTPASPQSSANPIFTLSTTPSAPTTQVSITPTVVTSTYVKQHSLLVMGENPDPRGSLASNSIFTIRADGTGKKVLTGPGNQNPSWTPDGKIIFVSNRSGSPQVWVMDEDGTNPKQIGNLSMSGRIERMQMAKNGLIAFKGGGGIWLMQKDGSGLRQLVSFRDTGGDAPSLAPSGTWLTYTAGNEAGHNEIFRINTDGTGRRQLTFPTDSHYPDGNASSISPDETMVAIFTGTESRPDDGDITDGGVNKAATTYRNIGVMPAGGGTVRLLTACHPVFTLQELQQMAQENPQNPGACNTSDNPTWSPDGKWLIYDRGSPNPDGRGTWAIDINGNNMHRLNPAFVGGESVPLKYDD